MKELIQRAKDALPVEYKNKPWTLPELAHGTAILKNEQQLDAYTAAYGEMHQIKCRAALQNFPFKDISDSVQIVDWGCGQGFGSYCTIRAFLEHNKAQWIRNITLIEPSLCALRKAVNNINSITGGRVNIIERQQYCPGNGTKDEVNSIDYPCRNVIHIFSNILDIQSVDIQRLSKICATSSCKVFILCMGPVNSNVYRIDQFCSIFGQQKYFSNIEECRYGITSDTGHPVSCKTKCFAYDGSALVPNNADKICKPDYFGGKLVNDDYELPLYGNFIPKELRSLYEILSLQINTEEDFIILEPNIDGDKVDMMIMRPNKGILIIKLFNKDLNDYIFATKKDKNGHDVPNKYDIVDKYSGEIIISPIISIGGYQKKLLTGKVEELLCKVIANSKNWKIVQKLVLFTKNTTEEARNFFRDNFDYTLIFGYDELEGNLFRDNFLNKIVFRDYLPDFSKSIMSAFLRVIAPERHSRKEGKEVTLNTPQRKLSKSEANKSQKICGVAGSGKTLVLATRCVNAQRRTGGDVLVLTYNKTLANYMRHRINEVREDFPWSKIHISHYHKFFRQHAHLCSKHVHLSSYEDEAFFNETTTHCDSLQKYDAIFVDEVQDYMTEWLHILQRYFLKENGEFVVFGDPKQNVYKRTLDTNGDIRLGVIQGEWNHKLKDSKRYHNLQLLKLFNSFQECFFSNVELAGGDELCVSDNQLSCIKYSNIGKVQCIDSLYNTIESLFAQYELRDNEVTIIAHSNDIMRDLADMYQSKSDKILSTTFCTDDDLKELRKQSNNRTQSQYMSDVESIDNLKKYNFNYDSPGVKLSTIDSFKGWESPTVILIIQNEAPNDVLFSVPRGTMTAEVVYTGITRATESLFIINLGNNKFDEFFSKNIK